MRVWAGWFIAIQIAFCIGMPWTVCWGDDISTALARFKATTRPYSRLSLRARVIHCGKVNFSSPRTNWSRTDTEMYLRDGDIDVRTNAWNWQGDITADKHSYEAEDMKSRRDIWDGRTLYNYYADDFRHRYQLFVSGSKTDPQDLQRQVAALYSVMLPDAPPRGFLRGDWINFVEIFEKLDPKDVVTRSEVFSGNPCFVIKAMTPYGVFEVWFDENRGFNVVKATVHKSTNDLYYGAALATPPSAQWVAMMRASNYPASAPSDYVFEISDVKLGQVGSLWVPVSGRWKSKIQYSDGGSLEDSDDYQSLAVNFSPSFDTAGAFEPKFVEGADAAIIGEQSNIPLEWRSGKVQPRIDEDAHKSLDQKINELLQGQGPTTNK